MARPERIQKLINSLDEEFDLIVKEIDDKNEELVSLFSDISIHKELSVHAQKEWDDTRKRLTTEEASLQASVEPLRATLHALEYDTSAEVKKKADLKADNIRLHTQNTHFKEYETKAWKVLKAKEAELIEREKVLQQKESLRPQNTGLLPTIS